MGSEQKKSASSGGSTRFWLMVWGMGLAGQLCWNVENQWFNTFVYAKIAKDPTIISWMVAVSAITTTIATFLFGTLSDRPVRMNGDRRDGRAACPRLFRHHD